MLKNIHLHIEKNNNKQEELEVALAKHITQTQKDNINAFQRHIPSVVDIIKHSHSQNISVFCNKYGEHNFVDYGTGRAVYGFHPKAEITEQVEFFCQHPNYIPLSEEVKSSIKTNKKVTDISLLNESPALEYQLTQAPLPHQLECLVILGIGLGVHIQQLIEQHEIRHLIIYEAEPQYFSNSILVSEWKNTLEQAQKKSTNIYLQIGKDGRDLVSDINELKSHFNIDGFYIYKHHNHVVYDSVIEQVRKRAWLDLTEEGIHFNLQETPNRYCPPWLPQIKLSQAKLCNTDAPIFQSNMSAFKKYFPAIYERFIDYKPGNWLSIESPDNSVNLLEKEKLVTWYAQNSKSECKQNFEGFNQFPHKDGLVLGYNGKKLSHYQHYKFVKATEKFLAEAEDENSALPNDIKSIIIFGLGVGYQLEELLEKHTVEKLFICEPNNDYFYGSLFAIDWAEIFEKIDKSQHRIYLNIGDDGTNLFRDLLNQFHSIGPYILNNTYFYQSYYNATLNQAIAQLREQLRIVISMGEYFDHAYYGIAHTHKAIKQNTLILKKQTNSMLSYDDKEVPVFIIGNGPSLDHSIEAIKEWQNKAIIISCGTCLQVLHRHGIRPDFHAEIEQNRTTFDWASLIDDPEYLKQVNLISCNGIHPDTIELYNQTFVAFKEGESSTVSSLEIVGRDNFEVLEHAFPTVSNFATNIFSTIGFKNIYFIGVDLGFIDKSHHHSKLSSYYKEDGEELYNYAESNNTSLQVAGNFRPVVSTKHEFKISKEILEQTIIVYNKEVAYFNCSDGARINGTTPLQLDDILITGNQANKASAINNLKKQSFTSLNNQEFTEKFESKFCNTTLNNELVQFTNLIETEISNKQEAEGLINSQKEFLFDSYRSGKSLLFYYLYGTVNYSNALLTKLLYSNNSDEVDPSFFEALTHWKTTFKSITKQILSKPKNFDTSAFRAYQRENLILTKYVQSKSLLVVTNSDCFKDSVNFVVNQQLSWKINVKFIALESISTLVTQKFDFVIYNQFPATHQVSIPLKGQYSTSYTLYNRDTNTIRNLCEEYPGITFCPINIESDAKSPQNWFSDQLTVAGSLINFSVLGEKCQVMLPKLVVPKNYNKLKLKAQLFETQGTDTILDYGLYIAVQCNSEGVELNVLNNGTRGRLLTEEIELNNHILVEYEQSLFDSEWERMKRCIPTLEKNYCQVS